MAKSMQVRKFRSKRGRGASVRKEPVKPARSWSGLGRALMAIVGLGLTGLAGYAIHDAYQNLNQQKIEHVVIEGRLDYVSESDVSNTVFNYINESLLAVDLDLLKQELDAKPWIKQTMIRREWPDKLIVNVEEEMAIARWGKAELLNQQGQLFRPDSVLGQEHLPYLSGPENSEPLVMEQYQQFNQLLYPLGLRIRDLTLSDRGAWVMFLTNGVEIKVGREAMLERLRRLVTFLDDDFIARMDGIQTIDLRYSNGIAVAKREFIPEADENVVSL